MATDPLWKQFNLTPDNNNVDPPRGAPEGMNPKTVNDTMRLMMAAIRELGESMPVLPSTPGSPGTPIPPGTPLGGMALQDPNAVNITGGAVALGVLPKFVIMLWAGLAADVPVGWNICDGQNGTPDLRGAFAIGVDPFHAVGAVTGVAPASAAGYTTPPFLSGSGGIHNHGSATAGHVLTLTEMPNTIPIQVTNTGVYQVQRGAATGDLEVSVVGNNAHTHGIGNSDPHTHSVGLPAINPRRVGLYYIMKTS